MNKRPHILLLGENGQLGWELKRALASLGHVHALDSGALDMVDTDKLRRTLRELAPELIVNPAAYTRVDSAEEDASRAYALNVHAPKVLAEEARKLGSVLVHFSSDYVFNGEGSQPWHEEDLCAPINVYGASKREGEIAIQAVGCRHFIFRTSWVYGARGHNFLRTMRRLMQEKTEMKIVSDQVGAPTWCRDLAVASAQVLSQVLSPLGDATQPKHWGVYHMCNAGETSWHGFAQAIQAIDTSFGGPGAARLLPILTRDYPTPARRPLNSRLSCDKLEQTFGLRLQPWQRALALCMDEMNNRANDQES